MVLVLAHVSSVEALFGVMQNSFQRALDALGQSVGTANDIVARQWHVRPLPIASVSFLAGQRGTDEDAPSSQAMCSR